MSTILFSVREIDEHNIEEFLLLQIVCHTKRVVIRTTFLVFEVSIGLNLGSSQHGPTYWNLFIGLKKLAIKRFLHILTLTYT